MTPPFVDKLNQDVCDLIHIASYHTVSNYTVENFKTLLKRVAEKYEEFNLLIKSCDDFSAYFKKIQAYTIYTKADKVLKSSKIHYIKTDLVNFIDLLYSTEKLLKNIIDYELKTKKENSSKENNTDESNTKYDYEFIGGLITKQYNAICSIYHDYSNKINKIDKIIDIHKDELSTF